tara:strand:+ start:320 stop:559 length:240 start_codon:yes stop_codon:yes gene_type:complete
MTKVKDIMCSTILVIILIITSSCSGVAMYIGNVASGVTASFLDRNIEKNALEERIENLEKKLDDKEKADECEDCEVDKL